MSLSQFKSHMQMVHSTEKIALVELVAIEAAVEIEASVAIEASGEVEAYVENDNQSEYQLQDMALIQKNYQPQNQSFENLQTWQSSQKFA